MMASLRSHRTPAAAALLLVAAAGCSTSPDRILDLDAEGTAFVFLFRDDNLNMVFNNTVDVVLTGVQVDLRLSNAINTRPGGVTDSLGLRVFRVAAGRYVAEVSPDILGDSLVITAGTNPFTVPANDSTLVQVALAFKTITITEARALPLGRAAWVRGIVMNPPGVFGDSTVHIVDDSAAIRTTHVRPGLPLLPGDSALLLGRRTTRDGQPTIELLVVPVVQGLVAAPPPDSISTATASTANGGALDARFAKVAAATVSDTATVDGAFTLTVNDGTGDLTVVFSPIVNFGNPNQYAPAVVLDIQGLLVPNPLDPTEFVLKPRQRPDITIRPVPPTT